jgi:signal transduction histidine kinase
MSWSSSLTTIYNSMPTLFFKSLLLLFLVNSSSIGYAFSGDNHLNPSQIKNSKLAKDTLNSRSIPIIRFGDNAGTSNVYSTRNTEYLIDSLGVVTLDKLLHKNSVYQEYSFYSSKNELYQNMGFAKTTWIRFSIQRDTSASSPYPASNHSSAFLDKTEQFNRNIVPFVLALGSRDADSVELYITQGNTVVYADTVGFSVPYRRWKLTSTQIAFPLPAMCNSGEVFTCFVRVRASDIFLYYLLLTPKETFISNEYTFLRPLLLFYGIAAFALFYNLLVWISTRSFFYGIYIAYVFCTCLSLSITSGHWYQLFSIDIPHLNTPLFYAFWIMSMALGVLFVTALVRESNKNSVPRIWHWLAFGFWGSCVLVFVLELLGLREYAINIPYYSYLLLALPSTLGMSFWAWNNGYRPAFFLFVARVIVEIGLGVNMLTTLGYIEYSSIWINQLTILVPAIEMIFMGLALADRISYLQKAKQDAERKALEGELYRIKNVELSQANQEITRQQEELLEQSRDIQEMNGQVTHLNLSLKEQNIKLAETNREKDELMGIVVHDLKNPIGSIRGFAELLQFGIAPPEEIPLITSHITTTANRMLDLVANLLEVNRLESGGMQFQVTEVDITPIVEGAMWQYLSPAKTKQISLHFENTARSAMVVVDERAMIQVFDNLISNAVKYSPFDKNIFIRLTSTPEAVRFEVADEGPGISEEDMKKLFGKFARLTAQPTGDEHSTGLGLSIVKKMVGAMNGKVWCESELGKGARFIVELPVS